MRFVPKCVLPFVAAGVLALSAGAIPAVAASAVLVTFAEGYPAGTIVVHTDERRLFLVIDSRTAVEYTVGVGVAGLQWAGDTTIDGKYIQPNWAPPPAIRREQPDLPAVIPGGSPSNPMGAAAMTLAGGLYAIHGTNVPDSIGGFVSHGCIRMFNDDIMDLFNRVNVGARVVVMP